MDENTQNVATAQAAGGEPVKKKGKAWLWILLGCGGCFVCILAVVLCLVLTGGIGTWKLYSTVKEEVSKSNMLCKAENSSDLIGVYENYMSEDYRKKVSYLEFETMWRENKDLLKKCDLFVPSLQELLSGGAEITSESVGDNTIISIKREVGGKKISAKMSIDSEGNIRLEDLSIE